MRIIPESHHFKPSLDPAKRKSSPGKEGKISQDKDKYHDRIEITRHGDHSSEPSKILDDRYQRYPVTEGASGEKRPVSSRRLNKDDGPVSGNVPSNEDKIKIQKDRDAEKSLLEGIGLTDDRIDEIRQQISEGMYESIVVQKTVADMITRDLLKI
ncbi:MAG: hypothetical protein GXO75_01200 [Calditrichaeota bacterium]|nr:hypothetical protein [Calditrichota bacterium]